jgi:hypothetical protein
LEILDFSSTPVWIASSQSSGAGIVKQFLFSLKSVFFWIKSTFEYAARAGDADGPIVAKNILSEKGVRLWD